MKCGECYEPTMSDGHGELIHEDTGYYGCNVKAPKGGAYPVAS